MAASGPGRKYLPIFVAEAREHLSKMAAELVELERASTALAPPLFDALFRRLHSVKGSAATLELSEVVEVAHAAEALVGRLRASSGRPPRESVDLLLEACDLLGRLVDGAERDAAETPADRVAPAPEPAPQPSGELPEPTLPGRLAAELQRLEPVPQQPGALLAAAATAPALAPASPASSASASPLARFSITVLLSSKCAAPGARALIVQKRLAAQGSLLEFDPPPARLMQARGAQRLSALLASAREARELREVCLSVPEVESVEVVAQGPGLPGAQGPQARPPPGPPETLERTAPVVAVSPVPDEPRPERGESMVRVRAESLDQLLESAGEMLGGIARLREASRKLPETVLGPFEAEIDRLRRQARELHGRVVGLRLTPLSALTDRLPRAVRDLARQLGRELEVEIQGADVELDRATIDGLGDPLSHLVRNAVDHGIEPPEERHAAGKPACGKLLLRARRERDLVLIELEDDGRGLDPQALRRRAVELGALTEPAAAALTSAQSLALAFLPGLSTRKVLSTVSGRGVGLDAARRAVEGLGGHLEVHSQPGRGTRFTLELPRSLSMANLLLVLVGGELYGLQVSRVLLTTEVDLHARGGEGYESRSVIVADERVPAWSLAKLFRLPSLAPPGPRPFVVLEIDGVKFALSVDRLVGQEEAVVRPLFPPLDRMRSLAGTAVLGSGRPLLVLDPRGLGDLAGLQRSRATTALEGAA